MSLWWLLGIELCVGCFVLSYVEGAYLISQWRYFSAKIDACDVKKSLWLGLAWCVHREKVYR